MADERTEPATPKRRQDSRRRGQVGRSQDLSGVVVLLGGAALLRLVGGDMIHGLTNLMTGAFTRLGDGDLTAMSVIGDHRAVLMLVLGILLPFLSGLALISIAGNVLQTGPLLSAYPLKPQLSRVNPVQGAKRLLSRDSVVMLVRNLFKVLIVGGVLALALRSRGDDFQALGLAAPVDAMGRFAALAFEVVFMGAAALLALSLLDLVWQRSQHARKIRMSVKEVRDEHKNQEGDPLIKGRLRQLRRDFMNRMMSAVPEATVVITNPTEIAVALKYDPLEHDAPVVVAKGQRLVAERIRAIAAEHNIPLWEDRPLARALYTGATVGKPIPGPLFQAVAEVLAFVFRLRAGLPAQPPTAHTDLAPAGPLLGAAGVEA